MTHPSIDGLLVHPLGCMMNEIRESPNCVWQQSGLVLCCLITICLILYLLPPSKLSYEQWESAPLSNIHSQESDIECTKQPNPGGRRGVGGWAENNPQAPMHKLQKQGWGGWAKTIDKPDMTKHTSLPPGPNQSSHSSPRVPVTSTPSMALRNANPYV